MRKCIALFLSLSLSVVSFLTGCTSEVSFQEVNSQGSNVNTVIGEAAGMYMEIDVTPKEVNSANVVSMYPYENSTIAIFVDDNIYSGYISNDGVNWLLINSITMDNMVITNVESAKAIVDPQGNWWIAGIINDEIEINYFDSTGELSQITNIRSKADTILEIQLSANGLLVSSFLNNIFYWSYLSISDTVTNTFSNGVYSEYYTLRGDNLYVFNRQDNSIDIYNPNDGKIITSYKLPNAYSATQFSVADISDDSFIYVNSSGIQQIALGGTVTQVMVNNKGYAYTSPLYKASSIVSQGETYLIAYLTEEGSKIMRYSFNVDNGNVENDNNDTLYVWAMNRLQSLQTAVSVFTNKYPECEVILEYGRPDNESTLTDEDIVKNINTQLLGGTAPDVLILDGLPIASYIEKGLLSDIYDDISFLDLYGNIVSAYSSDGKTYAIPSNIQVPIFITDNTVTPPITNDFESFVKVIIETDNIYINGYQELFDVFYATNSPIMFPGGNSIDENELRDFLNSTFSIVQSKNITSESQERLSVVGTTTSDGTIIAVEPPSISEYGLQSNLMYAFGIEGSSSHLALSAFEHHDSNISLLPNNTFIPTRIASIPINAVNKDYAKKFIEIMLTDEATQSYGRINEGFSIMQGYESNRVSEKYDSHVGDGIEYKSNPTEYDWEQLLSGLERPSNTDAVLKEMVYSEAIKLYEGYQDVNQTVQSIMQATKLYFAERQ